MQNFTEKELLEQIKNLQEELQKIKKQKKYGIVWEEKEENIDKSKLPMLEEEVDLRIENDKNKPQNLIIEGDNFHVLSVLQNTHKSKIDVIYIDPPYNTGNKDFIYNDNYVDKEDSYRHSKWLSFMSKRLELAKNLLKDDGVIFISIDDNEFAQLKLLCDEIFGEENFIETFIWNSIFRPSNMGKLTRRNSEFILSYCKNFSETFEFIEAEEVPKGEPSLTQNNNKERILLFPENFVITKLKNGTFQKGRYGNNELLDDIYIKDGKIKNHFRMIGKFKWSQDYLNNEIQKGVKIIIKNNSLIPYYLKDYQKTSLRPTKIISNTIVGDVLEANTDLIKIFSEKKFDYSKPKSLIKFIIKILQKQTNSTILDFFAGSGTTGHAVLELNKEDGGKRQFILCSNRESTKENPEKNICCDITYERNKRVIQGYTNSKGEKIEGLGGNLRYYKTKFIPKNKSIDDLRDSFINKCDDLLCIKENTFTKVDFGEEIPELKIFKNKNNFTVILYDIFYLKKLITLLKLMEDKKINLYIFSQSKNIYEEELEDFTNITFANIPNEILETYKKIFGL